MVIEQVWATEPVPVHGGPVSKVVFFNHEIVSGGFDGRVLRWNGSLKPFAEMAALPAPIEAITSSSSTKPDSDGLLFVSSSTQTISLQGHVIRHVESDLSGVLTVLGPR